MPQNKRYILIFDFETDDVNPLICNPVQVAAVILDPRSLEILDTFESKIRPFNIDDKDYFVNHKDTIEWHGKNRKITAEKVLADWKESPDLKTVWKNFKEFNFKYHTKQSNQSSYTAPIPSGFNIVNFDLPIANRLCKQYGYIDTKGNSKLFSAVNKIDVYDLMFIWFENLHEPERLNAETLFTFLGLDMSGGHDALYDVKMTTKVLQRFLRFHRKIATSPDIFRGKLQEK